MNQLKKQNGFTLIELLVVIVVIILLATISIIALNGQRAKARDAKRISDIRQVRTALEFYRSDEGEYPIVLEPIVLGIKGADKLCSKLSGSFVSAETDCKNGTIYMTNVPGDPLVNQKFIYTGVKDGFDISFTTESASSLGPSGIYHAHSQSIDSVSGNK
jgi:prepilin-type N-terminal cleavage/methylation domain-containing protein